VLEDRIDNPDHEYPGVPGSDYSGMDPELLQNALASAEEKLDELVQQREDLLTQIDEQEIREAEAEVTYKAAVAVAENAYNYDYHYTDSEGESQVEEVRGGDHIRNLLLCEEDDGGDLKRAHCENSSVPQLTYPWFYGYVNTAEGKMNEQIDVYSEAQAACDSAADSVEALENQMSDPDYQAQPEEIWTDPEAILQRADERGVLR